MSPWLLCFQRNESMTAASGSKRRRDKAGAKRQGDVILSMSVTIAEVVVVAVGKDFHLGLRPL